MDQIRFFHSKAKLFFGETGTRVPSQRILSHLAGFSSWRVASAVGVAITLSSSAWADVQWHTNFKNGSRAFIRVLDSGDYRVGFQQQGSTYKKIIKEGKKLKTLEGELDEGTGIVPDSILALIPNVEKGFTQFSDATDRYLIFPDGSMTKAPSGDWTEINAQLLIHKGVSYAVQSYNAALKSRTDIVRISDGRHFDLDSVFHADLHQLSLTIQGDTLVIPSIEGRADLVNFRPIPVVSYAGEAFELRTHAEGMQFVRVRDSLAMKVDDKEWKIPSTDQFFELKDGIVEFPVGNLRVDLSQFEAEVARSSFLKKGDVVLNDADVAVDPATDVLANFTDLVADSRKNPRHYTEKMDPQILEEIAEALGERKSAVLLGRAGTGKSSAIRAFAREVGLGHVVGFPRTTRIVQVKPSNLSSGGSKVGVIPKRVASLVSAAQQTGMIIFIDEFHSLRGVGTHSNQSNDVTQSFKEPLEKGEMVMLATDTTQEYFNAFGGDSAFDQRFEKITVSAPTGAEVISMAKSTLGARQRAIPDDEVLQAALQMSTEYDATTRQPRAMINLLLKGYGRMRTHGWVGQPLTLEVLKEAAVAKYKFDPAIYNIKKAAAKLSTLRQGLDASVIGQSAAKDAVVSLFEVGLAKVGDSTRVNSILFFGPSGVGKTKVAEASADLMGYEKTVIEMNRFRSPADVVEFRRAIHEAVAKFSRQVIILDELEKAHLAVQDAALSILQNGEFTVTTSANSGSQTTVEVNVSQCFFVMTSNAGEAFVRQELKGGNRVSIKELKQVVAAGGVSSHVLSRIRQVVPMGLPSRAEFKEGVERFLAHTLKRESEARNVTFTFKNLEGVVQEMVETYQPDQSDYRDIEAMMLEIDQKIAHAILTVDLPAGGLVELDWNSKEQRRAKPVWNPLYL